MGGRGGASGAGGGGGKSWEKSIPGKNAFEAQELPKLTGTDKDVQRAEAIRDRIDEELGAYAITRTSDGHPSGIYDIALQGKAAIIKDVNQTVDLLGEGRREATINAYKDLARRMSAYNKIMTEHTDAKWWINQSVANTPEKYMNKNLKKIIDGK